MSIQQGLISPPLSGRTNKADHPHKVIDAVDVFGSTGQQREPSHFDRSHHPSIASPVKKHHDSLSEAEHAAPPLTPPMSKDVRHDAQTRQREELANRHRTSSEADLFDLDAPSASACAAHLAAPVQVRTASSASTSRPGLLEAAHIDNRFDTLNNGVDFACHGDHIPFLNRKLPASSSSYSEAFKFACPASATSQPPYSQYDAFDSDQDADGSVHEDDFASDLHGNATPRASSSSNATTAPARIDNAPVYRPARSFSTHVRVSNEPVTSTIPIRDTPKNPFLAGGPADIGFEGPNRHLAYRRARQIPGKERGKITYVFRGQRVTYADPEYDSEDDHSELEDERARVNAFNPHHKQDHPPRLQPKLLFPPSIPSSAYATAGSSSSRKSGHLHAPASVASRRSYTSQAYLPRAELADDEFGGAGSRCGSEERGRVSSNGAGLFAAQIAAEQQQERQATAAPKIAPWYASRSTFHDGTRSQEEKEYSGDPLPSKQHHYTAPSSSARLQNIVHDSYSASEETAAIEPRRCAGDEERRTARAALLARLDQINWSDDEGDDDEGGDNRFGRRRARAGSEGTLDEDEEQYPVQSYALPCSQSQRKRLSDELQLQPGHAEEMDVVGRPMKRSRASYAY